MISFSQAAQDLYVIAMLGMKQYGSYLDIGCYVPKEGNNTYLLDTAFGWDGISIDNHPHDYHLEPRRGNFILHDATQPYPQEAHEKRNRIAKDGVIDYLSLDADEATNAALPVALAFARYRIITIEHDLYARGKEWQQVQRDQLNEAGYVLHVPNVHITGKPEMVFEDWWLSPQLFLEWDIQFTEGPHDAESVVKSLWLEKFGEPINIQIIGGPNQI